MKKAILATKVGMTQIFNEDGQLIPVTVLQAGPCVVTQVKTEENDGYEAVQVGFGDIRESLVNKPEKGHFDKAGVAVKRFVKEFRFDNAAEYTVGQEIKADIFADGDHIDATAVSKGKGFQGAIKRHGQSRGPMAHGSKYHRHAGSNGACSDPSKVFKGKHMPGHMGNVQVTVPVSYTHLVTYTGTCFLPSWTAIVCPTKDGKIVERRDQVLITDLSFAAFNASTFLSKLASAKGPFFSERDMLNPPYYFDNAFPSRLLTMSLLDALFFFLVFRPRAGLPQGVHGPGRPTGARPSPPPCGWSFGFMTEPRTVGLIPM